jgi:hypothetical protein
MGHEYNDEKLVFFIHTTSILHGGTSSGSLKLGDICHKVGGAKKLKQ